MQAVSENTGKGAVTQVSFWRDVFSVYDGRRYSNWLEAEDDLRRLLETRRLPSGFTWQSLLRVAQDAGWLFEDPTGGLTFSLSGVSSSGAVSRAPLYRPSPLAERVGAL